MRQLSYCKAHFYQKTTNKTSFIKVFTRKASRLALFDSMMTNHFLSINSHTS